MITNKHFIFDPVESNRIVSQKYNKMPKSVEENIFQKEKKQYFLLFVHEMKFLQFKFISLSFSTSLSKQNQTKNLKAEFES